jgi:lysozyme family protein
MTKEFLDSMKFIFEHENVMSRGKVVSEHDPRDPGGTTKYGIDQRSHPGVDIENLTQEQATQIYWQEWLQCKADKIPWPLCFAYFDACVNSGEHQGALLLQRTVGVKDDGLVGPATIAAAVEACKVKPANEVALALCQKKEQFYKDLCKQKPQFNYAKSGWLNRVSDLKQTITKIC